MVKYEAPKAIVGCVVGVLGIFIPLMRGQVAYLRSRHLKILFQCKFCMCTAHGAMDFRAVATFKPQYIQRDDIVGLTLGPHSSHA
jgi:hypothetical protein